jgi:hypothetical protein
VIVTASEWSQIASLTGLTPAASPAEVISVLENRSSAKRAAQAAAEARSVAIRACRRCDEEGWRLGPDGRPTDDARRCDHATAQPSAARDVSEPLHPLALDQEDPA